MAVDITKLQQDIMDAEAKLAAALSAVQDADSKMSAVTTSFKALLTQVMSGSGITQEQVDGLDAQITAAEQSLDAITSALGDISSQEDAIITPPASGKA